MRDPEHAKMMLALARKDLRAVLLMAANDNFDIEIFGFHAQQAVEKSLKAWLSFLGIEYPRTRDLNLLIKLLEQNKEILPKQLHILVKLTDFAVQYRYESYIELISGIDRVEIGQLAADLVHHVEILIEKEGE